MRNRSMSGDVVLQPGTMSPIASAAPLLEASSSPPIFGSAWVYPQLPASTLSTRCSRMGVASDMLEPARPRARRARPPISGSWVRWEPTPARHWAGNIDGPSSSSTVSDVAAKTAEQRQSEQPPRARCDRSQPSIPSLGHGYDLENARAKWDGILADASIGFHQVACPIRRVEGRDGRRPRSKRLHAG